jgi:hypothetical protein
MTTRRSLDKLAAVAFEQVLRAPPRGETLQDMKHFIQAKGTVQIVWFSKSISRHASHVILDISIGESAYLLYQCGIRNIWRIF